MRISDWSSDVCSSDLQPLIHVHVNDLRAIFNLLPGDLDSGMVIASKDQLLELGGAGDVGAFTNVDENGGCLLGHCSFLPPLPLTRRRLGEGTEPLDGWFETRDRKSTRLTSSHSCACRMPSSA